MEEPQVNMLHILVSTVCLYIDNKGLPVVTGPVTNIIEVTFTKNFNSTYDICIYIIIYIYIYIWV